MKVEAAVVVVLVEGFQRADHAPLAQNDGVDAAQQRHRPSVRARSPANTTLATCGPGAAAKCGGPAGRVTARGCDVNRTEGEGGGEETNRESEKKREKKKNIREGLKDRG